MGSRAALKTKSTPAIGRQGYLIQDFEDCTLTLAHESGFGEYAVDTLHPNLMRLTRSDITIFFTTGNVVNNKEIVEILTAHLDRPEVALSYVTTAADLSPEFDALINKKINLLVLPLSLNQLRFHIDNIYYNQKRILSSELMRQEIQHSNDSVKYVLKASQELTGIHDTTKLLSLILKKTREVCHADAGSIYVVTWSDHKSKRGTLEFRVTQNESIPQQFNTFKMPIDDTSIVGTAVLHEVAINIPDLYQFDADPEKNQYKLRHNRSWDIKTGYQCRSMLTLPMFDIEKRVIGVIQLINRKNKGIKKLLTQSDFDNEVIAFDEKTVDYAKIVAQQSGIALENALLNEEKEQLFDSFVLASVTAIEQRDPHSSGHAGRVARMVKNFSEAVNNCKQGTYADVKFTKDQLKELEFASLLHDFGKIGVNENILTKQRKLYDWQYELLRERFCHAKTCIEVSSLRELIDHIRTSGVRGEALATSSILQTMEENYLILDQLYGLIDKSNSNQLLTASDFAKFIELSKVYFTAIDGTEREIITESEIESLSITDGVLTDREKHVMETHASKTYELLRKIPWLECYSKVPEIAAKHHEKLDGSGYPFHCKADEISVQSQILCIVDMFDTYTNQMKEGFKTKEAVLSLLRNEAKAKKIDEQLLNIFIENKIYEE